LNITEISAKTILRKGKKIDSWFISKYGMNLYRGCQHNCIYCDGRDEKYRVEDDFGKDLSVKINAPQLLDSELSRLVKRETGKTGFILLGGGVNDSYQPVEAKYKITQNALELLGKYDLPVHILTKSTLVERDIELIQEINRTTKVIVSFSFSSVDDDISRKVEPGVAPPSERLKVIDNLKSRGISCGMFLMPVIPFLTDTPEMIYKSLYSAYVSGIDFVVFGGMTLKEGRQKDYFHENFDSNYPDLSINYDVIYNGSKWGQPTEEYNNQVNQLFLFMASKFKMPIRIPPTIFNRFLDDNNRVVVILEQLDYMLKIRGQDSPYGYAAYGISNLKVPIGQMRNQLREIKGVGKVTERIIKEIIDNGSSSYYEKLLFFK